VLSVRFLVKGRGFSCLTSIGDFHVVVTERGAVYAMKCGEGDRCVDCVEFSLDDGVSVFIPRLFYHCLACLLAEFYNAGLFNLSVGGVVVAQRGAYYVPAMAKERDSPDRLVKRARGIFESRVLRLLAEALGPCCMWGR